MLIVWFPMDMFGLSYYRSNPPHLTTDRLDSQASSKPFAAIHPIFPVAHICIAGHHFGITFCVLHCSGLSTLVHFVAVLCALNTASCRDFLGQERAFVDTERPRNGLTTNQKVSGSIPDGATFFKAYF